MSNLLRKGKRIQEKKYKYHNKQFWKILAKMNKLTMDLVVNKEEVTEDNIQELAIKYIKRELDDMEKMIVLSKLTDFNGGK